MTFIADLHMHSKYSRACSKNLDLPHTHAFAQIKGIDLLTTADFTHPKWFATLLEQLIPVDQGIYALKEEYVSKATIQVPERCKRNVRYILTTEISLIYKKNGRVRKIHHIVLAPDLETVAKINIELEKRGNIHSDGRPILGLDSKELLKILLEISKEIQLIPAHVWTPHFSIFGSQSGFDSVEECFEELSDHICALETGLSSDPPMNWRLSKLDKYVLVSNSDAHSPQKMGREATIFETELNYPAILNALRHDHQKIAGTIEFFPEEGKYHADGIRDENLRWLPEETRRHQGLSPLTKKKVTIGVLHRVSDLADRPEKSKPPLSRPYFNIIPLAEVIAEVVGTTINSNKVAEKYFSLLSLLGSEFSILKDISIAEIARVDETIAEAIERMRAGKVMVNPGYDGVYGEIKLFKEEELREGKGQMSFF